MAERLTDKNYNAINKCSDYASCYSCRREICYIDELCNKLGKLEDILEKYNIESVGELEDKIICYEENKDVNLGLKFDIKKLEKDRDTWKRACELACIKLMPYRINMVGGLFTNDELKEKMDCFYQQAKKEGEKNNVQ